jgi:hypothetical protein
MGSVIARAPGAGRRRAEAGRAVGKPMSGHTVPPVQLATICVHRITGGACARSRFDHEQFVYGGSVARRSRVELVR